ncbi:HesB/YadR/YfhF family protein [Enterococcus sp. LJL99]
MQLTVTPKAQEWFEKEVGASSDNGIRFFGKIYGKTEVHDGFSIAMSVEQPEQPLIKEVLNGVPYFIEETDDWFFNGYDLTVDYDEVNDEPKYFFTKNQEDLAK